MPTQASPCHHCGSASTWHGFCRECEAAIPQWIKAAIRDAAHQRIRNRAMYERQIERALAHLRRRVMA